MRQHSDFKIQIPKPCHEDWNKMSANEQGRFCGSCCKTVVDFTKMNEAELKAFFLTKKKEEKVCGQFNTNQVTAYIPAFHSFLISLYNTIECNVSLYLLRQPALLMVGCVMFVVGCQTKQTTGESAWQESRDTAIVRLRSFKDTTEIRDHEKESTPSKRLPEHQIKFVPAQTTIGDVEVVEEKPSIMMGKAIRPLDHDTLMPKSMEKGEPEVLMGETIISK